MPRLYCRRPIENILRNTQANPHIIVAKRLKDWKRDLNVEKNRETKRNNTNFRLYKSSPPTNIQPQHPKGKSTREPTLRFYESVPPTYIGPRHPERTFPEQGIRKLTVRPVVYRHTYEKDLAEREKPDRAKKRSFNYPWRFLEYPAAQIKSRWAPPFEVDIREVRVKAPEVLRSEKRTKQDQSDKAAQRTGKDIDWLRADRRLPLPTDKKKRLFSLRPDRVQIQPKKKPTLEQTIQTLRRDFLQTEQRETQVRGISATQTRNFSQSSNTASMSDDAYSKFLEGANDMGATTQDSKSYKTKSVNTNVPKALESVEEYYTSDADEPFEPVSLEYEGRDISADELKKLIGHNANVSNVSEKEFDPQGQYKKVIDAVKKAGDGKVKVFRVEHGSTRAEYYVISVDEKEGRVVGLKALSVES